jgi:hypothetical protein
MKILFASFLFAVLTACVSASAPSASFFYVSSSQSFIGHGRTELLESDVWEFVARNLSRKQTPYQAISFRFSKSKSDLSEFRWFDISFATPVGQRFEIGRTYQATRFPFQKSDVAGLEFSGDGRGNNRLAGWFKVHELIVADGKIVSVALDFYQLDDHANPEIQRAMWNFGSIRMNSSVPLTTVVPEYPDKHVSPVPPVVAMVVF